MKTEIKEIYKCDHCNKLYQIKKACIKHEKHCKSNPEYLRPCHSCTVLKKVNETVWAGYGDPYGNEVERKVRILFCGKKDCFIHPPSVAAKGNAFETDKLNIEMPKECDLYEKPVEYTYFNGM
jgi:hypothetical protein